MELKELVKKNRSVRGFDQTRKISMETLVDFIDTVRFTASSVNLQPLKFYLSCAEEDNQKFLREIHLAGKLPELHLPVPGTEPTAYILIAIDTSKAQVTPFLRDVGIAAQTLTLLAAEKGYGCCMIGNFNKDSLKASLELPEAVEPNLVIALGTPAEKIVCTDWHEGESTDYYRDAEGTHFVPKKSVSDLLLNR